MKYLITGGAGFIGSNLVDYLLDVEKVPESDLRLLVPPWEDLRNLEGRELDILIGDIRNKKAVQKAMVDIDVVYHLAASTGSDGGEYEDFASTNVDGTRNLVEEAVKRKVFKFIFFSSIGIYGLPSIAGDMVNISEKSPQNFSEGYGRSKVEAEKILIKASRKSKMKYIIIRPSTVFGPKDKAGMAQMIKVISDGNFLRIGNGKNIMDYVFVGRLVSVARKLEKSGVKNDDFIVGSEKPMTQSQMVERVFKVLGLKFPRYYIPGKLALIGSFFVKYIFKLVGKRSPIFPNRVRVLTHTCYFDSSKIEKVADTETDKYNFDSGLKTTINWMRQTKIIYKN